MDYFGPNGEASLAALRLRQAAKTKMSLDFFELTTEPIDLTSVARRIVPPE